MAAPIAIDASVVVRYLTGDDKLRAEFIAQRDVTICNRRLRPNLSGRLMQARSNS